MEIRTVSDHEALTAFEQLDALWGGEDFAAGLGLLGEPRWSGTPPDVAGLGVSPPESSCHLVVSYYPDATGVQMLLSARTPCMAPSDLEQPS